MANQPALTDERFEEMAEEWSQSFCGRIPQEYLHKAFEDAAFTKGTSFAVNAYDIISSWSAIVADLQSKNKIVSCIQAKNHVTGDREIKVCHPNGMVDIIMPCVHCRPEDFHAAYSNVLAQTEEPMKRGVFEIVRAADRGELTGTDARDAYTRAFGVRNDDEMPDNSKMRPVSTTRHKLRAI